ncbi:MAG: carbamoyltransferase HypF [candidate division WOR-3 bacterium]|nr:carbamoyltransferase HypF [candidate division WOR-3 bacterium]
MKTLSILVKGQVQGIGFRPYVYNVAKKLNLSGIVKNTKQGVLIFCQGKNSRKFLSILKTSPPKLAKIDSIIVKSINTKIYTDFTIVASQPKTKNNICAVSIMPDLAICQECIAEILMPKNRRFYYPFTNCTQCGPRYSIILDTPYDRPRTTMAMFKMCPDCEKEYKNPQDRRFHAQPNACHICGPHLTLSPISQPLTIKKENSQKIIKNEISLLSQEKIKLLGIKKANSQEIIKKAVSLLNQGKILCIKSIGGFLLAVDAQNESAVRRLRKRKNRPRKPFALMCKDIKTIKQLCTINKEEENLLKSNIAPIVLLKKRLNPKLKIAESVAPNNAYLGIMLPYTPLHKLLFETKNVSHETFGNNKHKTIKKTSGQLKVLVMTSANPKDAPIITNAIDIKNRLSKCVDYILDHNRKIESRCDDSVVFNYQGQILIRRSRGYVPSPIELKNVNLKPVLAFGSDLKNCFALGEDKKVYLSPYIGDFGSNESIDFFWEMLTKYQKWFSIKPEIVACDLHPNYVSFRLAEAFAEKHKIPLLKIQHHFAHLVSVMAEHNLKPPVIGLSFDGTGFGPDGNIWGSEFMLVSYQNYQRLAHLRYLPLIGGDSAITNPKMICEAYLIELELLKKRPKVFTHNQIFTSSFARLFDAVAYLLGTCSLQTYEAEAPISLEAEAINFASSTKTKERIRYEIIQNSISLVNNRIDSRSKQIYQPALSLNNPKENLIRQSNKGSLPSHDVYQYDTFIIEPKPIFEFLIKQRDSGVETNRLSYLFHQWVIQTSVEVVKKISQQTKISQVCLAGGVFQNRIILNGIVSLLENSGFDVYFNRTVPINDGGIALGQAVVAGKKI